jgi:hypothetical protein
MKDLFNRIDERFPSTFYKFPHNQPELPPENADYDRNIKGFIMFQHTFVQKFSIPMEGIRWNSADRHFGNSGGLFPGWGNDEHFQHNSAHVTLGKPWHYLQVIICTGCRHHRIFIARCYRTLKSVLYLFIHKFRMGILDLPYIRVQNVLSLLH